MQRWRIQRKSLSPEEAGLTGCWQFIALWREREYLRAGEVYKSEEEYAYYVTSADSKAYDESQLLEAIRGHWDSIENGSHHRRDVSMGEDASGISKRPQAHMIGLTLQPCARVIRASKTPQQRQLSFLAPQNDTITGTQAH